jgi:hypothetical protein
VFVVGIIQAVLNLTLKQKIFVQAVNITTKLLLEKNLVIPATTETGGKNERNTESKKEISSDKGMEEFSKADVFTVWEGGSYNAKAPSQKLATPPSSS